MTTEQLDQEKLIEERDDTIDEFIDVVEETKQHQHPTVENAVSGYVEKPEKRDGLIYITVDVPAYDKEGEKQQFTERTETCNNPRAECNLDIVTYYINEDGEVLTTRSHTH